MALRGDLFERVVNAPVVPSGLPLIVLLTGFTDAGSAVAGTIEHLEETAGLQPVVVFDNDLLLDYRARRPIIVFEQDHLTEFRPARLELSLGHDTLGQPFLLLSGYEPDFAWNAFVDVVLDLVAELEISTVSWAHAIAMPVPHTRPIGTTVSGNRRELLLESVWRPRTQVPATAGHLLEFRLAERGHRVAGFVLLISHYLADTENPETVLAVADRLMTATGLVFDMDAVRSRAEEYFSRVNEQVAGSEELGHMLRTLEARYDAYMAGRDPDGVESEEAFDEQDLPSADELAAELERFLATRPSGEEDRPGGLGG